MTITVGQAAWFSCSGSELTSLHDVMSSLNI
jgi:hypothetical protein